jgi:hypothetical protein
VRISAAIDPTLDLPITLLDNGIPLGTLVSPSYSWDWATAAVPEGTHTIVAEVALTSGPVRSDAVTIVVDRTPPIVVSRTPAPGASNVMLRAPIQIAFSEPIRLTRPPDATFSLSTGGTTPVAIQPALDAQGRTAILRIEDPAGVAPPAKLAGTIGPGVTDLAGNPLAVPTGEWSWDVPGHVMLPPTPLCPGLPAGNRLPVFAVGSDLVPVLASATPITLSDGAHCQLQVSRYEAQRWIRYDAGAAGPFSGDFDSALRGAALALTPDDQPVVAWRPGATPDPGRIDVATWTGATWKSYPPIVPATGVAFPIIHPLLRVGPDGRPVLLGAAGAAADRAFLARWTGSAWAEEFGAVPIVSPQPFVGMPFDMILDDGGSPIVGWVNPITTGHVATWEDSSWTFAADVPDMTQPSLALDSTGAPMIVSQGSGTLLVQHRASATVWQPHPTVNVPPQSRHPRLAAGPDGFPVVAWYDAQTKSVGMGRWVGQRWNTRAAFLSPSNAADEAPQLIVDRHGTAWAGWRDTDGQFNIWMLNY